MCDEADDNFLAALKFIPDQFVTSKMIKQLVTTLYADDYILYFNEDSGDVAVSCNEIGFLSIYLNNINLDDTNYDEYASETIIYIRLLGWHIKLEKRKALKKVK